MARACWCGCGRQLGWSDYRVAKRARDHRALVLMLRQYTQPIYEASGRDPAELNEFIEAGERFTAEILMVAHGELSATEIDRRLANGWGKLAAKQVRVLGPGARREFAELRRTATL